jgi:cytochrome bd-type quinol oxidase subunit 1
MHMHTISTSDVLLSLFTFLPLVLYIILLAFGIYFVLKVIRFMNEKIKLDRKRKEMLHNIIKNMNQDKKD